MQALGPYSARGAKGATFRRWAATTHSAKRRALGKNTPAVFADQPIIASRVKNAFVRLSGQTNAENTTVSVDTVGIKLTLYFACLTNPVDASKEAGDLTAGPIKVAGKFFNAIAVDAKRAVAVLSVRTCTIGTHTS